MGRARWQRAIFPGEWTPALERGLEALPFSRRSAVRLEAGSVGGVDARE